MGDQHEGPELRLAQSAAAALLFGLVMGLIVAAGLLVLGRPMTGRSLAAASCIGISAALSAAAAMVAAGLLRRRRWTVRYAASLLILMAGTGALSATLVAVEMAWRFGHLVGLPIRIVGLILATLGIAALYYILTIVGLLILPLGLPLLFAMAALIAGRSR